MAIADKIQSIKTHLEDAYEIAEEKGATIPTEKNMVNLADTISSISGSGVKPKNFKEATDYMSNEASKILNAIKNDIFKQNVIGTYTDESIILHKPDEIFNTYIIRKNAQNLYQIVWIIENIISININSTEIQKKMFPHYIDMSSSKETETGQLIFTISTYRKTSENIAISGTYNTFDETIQAMRDNNVKYTIVGIARDINIINCNTELYTNGIFINNDGDLIPNNKTQDDVIGTKLISSNEIII